MLMESKQECEEAYEHHHSGLGRLEGPEVVRNVLKQHVRQGRVLLSVGRPVMRHNHHERVEESEKGAVEEGEQESREFRRGAFGNSGSSVQSVVVVGECVEKVTRSGLLKAFLVWHQRTVLHRTFFHLVQAHEEIDQLILVCTHPMIFSKKSNTTQNDATFQPFIYTLKTMGANIYRIKKYEYL